MDRVAKLKLRLQQFLAPEQLEITDDSHRHRGHAGAASGAGHYSVTIISAKFSGHTLVQRHRLVYQAVGDMMPGEIHALSIRALAPEET